MSYETNNFDIKLQEIVTGGGVGILPTDTIYGISCLALNKEAAERVKKLKGRGNDKAFIVLISDIKMLDLLSIDSEQAEAALKYWPGALTLECDTTHSPSWLPKIDNHFGVRMPGNPELLRLIGKTGPLISTSANLSGQPPAESAAAAKEIFGDRLDFYVDVGEIKGLPSTLVRNNNGRLEVLRQGAVKLN